MQVGVIPTQYGLSAVIIDAQRRGLAQQEAGIVRDNGIARAVDEIRIEIVARELPR